QAPSRFQRLAAAGEGGGAGGIEDDVPGLAAAGEILPGVVDHPFGPERAYQIDIAGAADAGHLGAEMPGDLHGSGTDGARGADHQHLLAGTDAALVAQVAERGGTAEGERGGFLEREIGRLVHDPPVLRQHPILGMAAEAGAGKGEDVIAGAEAGDGLADRLHSAGEFGAEDLLARAEEAEDQAAEEAEAGWHAEAAGPPVDRTDGGRPHPHPYFMVAGNGRLDLCQADDIRRPVLAVDCGFHDHCSGWDALTYRFSAHR